MKVSRPMLLTVIAAVPLALAPLAVAQSGNQTGAPASSSTPPAPCSASPQPAPCSATPNSASGSDSKGNAAQRFPFPGEETAPATPQAPAPFAPAAAPDAPSASKAPGAIPDAPSAPSGKSFPFPGEEPAAGDSGSSSSSSSSDAGPTPADAAPADGNSPDSGGRRLLKRVNPVGTKLQSPDEREAEDLKIARFYTDSGNLKGAYLRSQDAVKIMPDDAEAHCTLAETALKLSKRDEAIAEFNACLKLDPVDKEAKNARKELAHLK